MCATAPEGYSIVSTHLRNYEVEARSVTHLVADVRRPQEVERLFTTHRFDTVIQAAGIASVDYAERHYDEALESNLAGTMNVIAACRQANSRFIYISTNAVFDGTHAPYRESDPVCPINRYGQIKAECEQRVAESVEQHTIVRPILMYGWNHPTGRVNPATWLIGKLRQGETVRMVDDVYENPLYNLQCGEALWRIVEKGLSGVFHLAGGEVLNRYQFALNVASAFGLDGSLIRSVDSSDFPDIAARPRNTSFVTTRMEKELGIEPLSTEDGLRLMRDHPRVIG